MFSLNHKKLDLYIDDFELKDLPKIFKKHHKGKSMFFIKQLYLYIKNKFFERDTIKENTLQRFYTKINV